MVADHEEREERVKVMGMIMVLFGGGGGGRFLGDGLVWWSFWRLWWNK